jgi:L-ascorbate metabolism protein UlaG (beta-lactamase superfamily)
MEITWQGHACFQLRTDLVTVVTDPFPASLGLRMNLRPAAVATVSNAHPNHCNWEEVPGEPKVFRAPGEYEFSGVSVRGVMTGLAEDAPQEQRNVAYSIELDGVNVCHLGDIAAPLTPRQVDELSPVDVLMVPTGGRCTLALPQAAQAIQDLSPSIVVPMHYRLPGVDVDLAELDDFLRLLGGSEIQPQPRLNVTSNNLPADRRVTVLNVQARPV